MKKINISKSLNKNAATNIYVSLVALGLVIIIFAIYTTSIQDFNVPYKVSDQSSYDQSMAISESLIVDSGKSDTTNSWEDFPDSVQKIGFKSADMLFSVIYNETSGRYEIEDFNSGGIPSAVDTTSLKITHGILEPDEPCFLAGTEILMADGSYKNIEDIKIGDKVSSYDEKTDSQTVGEVCEVFHHKPSEMTDHYIILNDFLKVTPNHMFYTSEGWIEAGELKIGDYLEYDEPVEINSIEKVFKRVPTYNFEVDIYHTYIVRLDDTESSIVHNAARALDKVVYQHIENVYDPPCFLAGTEILMADGSYKNIEDIKIGDKVSSYDEKTDSQTVGEVCEVFHHKPSEMTDHYIILNDFLKVTPNHMFYTSEGWIEAGELKIGDYLEYDEPVEINSIEKVFKRVPTFNFEVDIYHTYVVRLDDSDSSIVHNALAAKQDPLINDDDDDEDDDDDSCFLAGTKVLMANGEYRNIEDIKLGEKVVTHDTLNDKREVGTVVYLFHHKPSEMTDYYLILNDFLKVTPNHMFYTTKGWVEAGDLTIGDYIGTSKKYEIESIEKVFEKVPTYNIEVTPYHNYIVASAEEDVLVHNTEKQAVIMDDDDSCCFPEGTMVTMADGTTKPIEEVVVGEYVLSYDTVNQCFVKNIVKETVSPVRSGVYSINDGLVCPTDDHPFYTMKSDGRVGWASIVPEKTEKGYLMTPMTLEVGDKIFTSDERWVEIDSIDYIKGSIQTYNLEDVSGVSNFFANDVLVHNAVDCTGGSIGENVDPVNPDDDDGSTTGKIIGWITIIDLDEGGGTDIASYLFKGATLAHLNNIENPFDAMLDTELLSYGIISEQKLLALSNNITYESLFEFLGLDEIEGIKYGSDIYLTVRNTQTGELIWSYGKIDYNKDITTIYSRGLTLRTAEIEYIPVLFQIMVSSV